MVIRLPYPPDDPRVAEFAVELARARGEDSAKWFGSRWRTWPWLIWSGPLPDDGDEEAAINAFVRKGWWQFNGKGKVTEIADERWVLDTLSWFIGMRRPTRPS